jgi:hypothetical protein
MKISEGQKKKKHYNTHLWNLQGQGTAVGADDIAKQEREHKPSTETGPLKPPRTPYASSPRLESTGSLNPPPDPITQQKRSHSTTTISWKKSVVQGLTAL